MEGGPRAPSRPTGRLCGCRIATAPWRQAGGRAGGESAAPPRRPPPELGAAFALRPSLYPGALPRRSNTSSHHPGACPPAAVPSPTAMMPFDTSRFFFSKNQKPSERVLGAHRPPVPQTPSRGALPASGAVLWGGNERASASPALFTRDEILPPSCSNKKGFSEGCNS